jgi:predicted DNA-binding transcriptional regulator YafY
VRRNPVYAITFVSTRADDNENRTHFRDTKDDIVGKGSRSPDNPVSPSDRRTSTANVAHGVGPNMSHAASSATGARTGIAGLKHVSDLHRLLRVLTLVQSAPGWTAAKLAAELNVTERTIFRDIKKLQGVGIPLSARGGSKGFQVTGETFLAPLQLSAEEAIALAVLCEEIASREQIPFLRPARRALEKVQAQLPAALREQVRSAAESMVIQAAPAGPGEQYEDVYERMREAIRARRSVECEYEQVNSDAVGARGPFLFEPYALAYVVRAWYAIGRHAGRNAVRTLKLSRFARVTPAVPLYEIPKGFSVQEHFGNAWRMMRGEKEHAVEIEFRQPLAETVAETIWHPTQEIEHRADGTLVFRCTVAGLDEIVWWVLSMGPSCTVNKPTELAERVKDLAAQTAAVYEKTRAKPAAETGDARPPGKKNAKAR